MGASRRTLVVEIAVASAFMLFAILGYKRNLWLVVAAIVGHGVFDFGPSFLHPKPWGTALVAWLLFGIRCSSWSLVGRAPDAA